LLDEDELHSATAATKTGGIPRNLSSGQLSRGLAMKRKQSLRGSGASPALALAPSSHSVNYKSLLRRQTTRREQRLGQELLEQARPIID